MSAHTPGPWAVNPFNAQVDSAVNGAPVPVCQMLWPTSLRTEDQTEANARLIAAAPDLLEALKELDERLRKCIAEPISAAEAYDSFYQDIVSDAIAKAEAAS